MFAFAIAALVASLAGAATTADTARKAQHAQQDAAAAAARQAEQAAALANQNAAQTKTTDVVAGTSPTDTATQSLLARKRSQPTSAGSNISIGV